MIEVGKRYKVVRIDNEWENYVPQLGKFLNKIVTVSSLYENDVSFEEDEMGWSFHKDWLEEIIEQEPQSSVDTDDQFKDQFAQPVIQKKELSGEDIADIISNNSAKKIRRFESGAVRSDDTGRLRPDFISPYAINEIAKHFTEAKSDFGATNYYLGIKPKDIFPSLTRHWLDLNIARVEGNKKLEREEYAAIAANCIMALHQIVLEEKGLYKEVYENVELVDANEYLKSL